MLYCGKAITLAAENVLMNILREVLFLSGAAASMRRVEAVDSCGGGNELVVFYIRCHCSSSNNVSTSFSQLVGY